MDKLLQITLADAVGMLQAEGVPYALIGGLAASLRGQPRVTADVDLVMAADLDAALALATRLDATPFQPLFPGVDQVDERTFILLLRHRRTGIKVDLAIGLSGFERQSVARKTPLTLAACEVLVRPSRT